jgi:P-type Ca2+ transporter type 2C
VVDEMIHVDHTSSPGSQRVPSPAFRKTLEIGSLCNNASLSKNEHGAYIGQSTDVALLNALSAFDMSDQRQVINSFSLVVDGHTHEIQVIY